MYICYISSGIDDDMSMIMDYRNIIILLWIEYSHFTISCPDCTMHTAINHMIIALERQSLVCYTPSQFIIAYYNHTSDCIVQCAIGARKCYITVLEKCSKVEGAKPVDEEFAAQSYQMCLQVRHHFQCMQGSMGL